MKWKVLLVVVLAFAASAGFVLYTAGDDNLSYRNVSELSTVSKTSEEITTEPVSGLPNSKFIDGLAHVGQSFNNCSSVGLMITLSHWGIRETQEAIAEATRPWNNPRGDNDDKSVTLYELADYAREKHGMLTYVRPNGNIELLKKFLANDIPVLTRALMYPKDDIVHYRVIRGYDESKQIVIESDGIEGPNTPYTYQNWMRMWKDFNYAYAILVPASKKALVESILAEELDEKLAWQNALVRAEAESAKDPSDLRAKYNIVTALYYTGDYSGTVREFEKLENSLSRRKLWYQLEPIQAYFTLGNFDRVIELADRQINDKNKSVSELYVLKGKIFEGRGDISAARAEYEKAVMYNKHYRPGIDALAALGA